MASHSFPHLLRFCCEAVLGSEDTAENQIAFLPLGQVLDELSPEVAKGTVHGPLGFSPCPAFTVKGRVQLIHWEDGENRRDSPFINRLRSALTSAFLQWEEWHQFYTYQLSPHHHSPMLHILFLSSVPIYPSLLTHSHLHINKLQPPN